MTDADFMQLALQIAQESAKNGGSPFAAVIVKEDQVVADGVPTVSADIDPSGHNEMNAMREACTALGSLDLAGCTLYTTIEPCLMCLTAAGWTNVSRIVFGAYQEDFPGNSYLVFQYHAETFTNYLTTINGFKIAVQGGVLRSECAGLMKKVKNWANNP